MTGYKHEVIEIRFLNGCTPVKETSLPAIRVVAGLLFRGKSLLVCQRRPDGSFPLKWEFPGGKLEKGESWAAALRRELKEELAIEAEDIKEVFTTIYTYPGVYKVTLKVFEVHRFSGVLQNRVFNTIEWVTVEDLGRLDFLEADLPLIQKLTRKSY